MSALEQHPFYLSFERFLVNVDQEVAEKKVAEVLRQKQQIVQAEERSTRVVAKKLAELEMIKECLAVVDPMLSSGMLIIARRTWGENGFGFREYGLGYSTEKPTPISELLKTGSSWLPTREEFDFDETHAEDLSAMYKSYAQFIYRTHQIDVGPYPDYYTCSIDFIGGKPRSIGVQTIDYVGSNAIDLRKNPDFLTAGGISRVLGSLYRAGPLHDFPPQLGEAG